MLESIRTQRRFTCSIKTHHCIENVMFFRMEQKNASLGLPSRHVISFMHSLRD